MTLGSRIKSLIEDPSLLTRCTLDWKGVDAVFRSRLESMTDKDTDRTAVEAELAALITNVVADCNRLLESGLFEEAAFGATISLKMSELLFGNTSHNLIPSYLIIAKTNYAVQKFKKCEQFLSLAHWAVVKHPTAVSSKIRAELHLYMGLLYASTQRLDEAVENLSLHVYYTALDYGPHATQCAPGYLQLGNVFAAKNQIDAAVAAYDKVESIWKAFMEAPQPLEGISADDALRCISRIVDVKIQRYGTEDVRTADSQWLLGKMYKWCGEGEKARDFFVAAYEVLRTQLGETHDQSVAILAEIHAL